MTKEMRVSTPEDFPNVAVYARDGVLRVVFAHDEDGGFVTELANFLLSLLFVAAGCAGAYGVLEFLIKPGYIPQGIWAVVSLFVVFVVIYTLLVWWFNVSWGPPFWTGREIQLDTVQDQFRVYRNGKLETTRLLSRLHTMTIEEHPKAEIERQKKPGKVGRYQKQHCLIGWFGASGAERVPLLGRWEYPVQNSLLEVQKAIHFAYTISEKAREMATAPESEGEMRRPAAPGIKPPLD